jgi:RAB protein geranylgeranyltransferase component A
MDEIAKEYDVIVLGTGMLEMKQALGEPRVA